MLAVSRYLTPPAGVHALGAAVTGVGRITDQSTSRTERTLASYAGVLVTAGSGSLSLHGRPTTHEVHAGAFFWLPPGVAHSYGPAPDTWSEYWILFEGPATARYEDLGYLGGGPAVVEPADPDGTHQLLVRLLDVAGEPESLAGHVRAAAMLHALIGAVGTARTTRMPPEPGRRDIGRRALELLARDADGPVGAGVGAVARELAVSRDTLATAVRELTGSTPTGYVVRIRLTRAKSLLADTDLSVSRIAAEVGYDDPAYFTRVFARHVGVAPTVFRHQERRDRQR
ncbi:helix-turn-helix domain-containing protein [Longispora urticae]